MHTRTHAVQPAHMMHMLAIRRRGKQSYTRMYTHSQSTHLGRVCGYVATPILEMDDYQEFELDQEKLMLACVCGIIAGVAVAYTKINDM